MDNPEPQTVADQIDAILQGGVSIDPTTISVVTVRLQFKVEDLEAKLMKMTQLAHALDATAERFRDERDAALKDADGGRDAC